MEKIEIISTNINKYMDLQRILKADDKEAETLNQIRAVKAILEACGVAVENLELK
ncbi:MAG: hypothetical protein LUD81_06260 [Clostridiales bacterium]|nr:hypothetical protein [Clostridiales bacterium]